MNPRITVIVPLLNDEDQLERNISPLSHDPRIEVIIVRAEEAGKANRAYQMNLGARKSRGDLLVFVHADTRVNPEDLLELDYLMSQDPEWVGGAFRFALDRSGFKARLIEFGVRLRERVFQLPYGDQAIFIRKALFEELNGYPEVPLLEDVLLIQKMKGLGPLFCYPKRAVTSSRHWDKQGYLKTTLTNWTTMILWRLGVSLEVITHFRRRVFYGFVSGNVKKTSARNHAEAA